MNQNLISFSPLLIFLAFVYSTNALNQKDIKISGEFDCSNKPNGLYLNPQKCETFYKCSNYYAYLYECPDGLHFNPTLLACDWPDNSGCTISENPQDPEINPLDFCDGKECGIYENLKDCDSFYECKKIDGEVQTIIHNCPPGLFFNSELSLCDFPDKSSCFVSDFIFSCEGKPNGNYPNPSNVYTFYTCTCGNPHLMSCPENTKYNNESNKCECVN